MSNAPLPPALIALELDRVLALIGLEARSDVGRAAVGARRPLATAAECERAHSQLAEMVRFFSGEGGLPLAGLVDVAPMFDRDTVLDLDESWQVVRALRATQSVREVFLRSDTFPRLHELASGIPDLTDLSARAGRYFTKDGKLREEASAELRSIRSRIQSKRNAVQKSLNDLMNRNADAIQEPLIVIRNERYCIPVRADHRNAVPGILHERSGSGMSFFIEPLSVVEANNDLADLLIQEREEIARITRFVSQTLFDAADSIVDAVNVTAEFDALQACAVFAGDVGASRPRFSEERELHLLDARHPLLDERLARAREVAFGERPLGQNVVPVTIRLDRESPALAVSGPNAGGKTVALKTAGLVIAMAMSGLPVPAEEGTVIPVVDALHVLIGDDQSVLEHLSTFSAYLVRLKRVLERATARSLVLLDELGSGTDPEEGAALAAATIEHFLEVGALMIVTTHLSALKTFAVEDGRVVNASMQFDMESGQPTYRMITGVPGRSRAIDVARMIGIPSSVIDRARARLGDRFGETDQLLSQLQKKLGEIVAREDEITALEREIAAEREQLSAKARQLEAERTKLGAKYRDELEHIRDDVTRQLGAELKALREADAKSRAQTNPDKVLQVITRPLERASEFAPIDTREVRVGDQAEHRRLKMRGVVASIDGAKATLSVGNKKIQVETRDLVPLNVTKPPAPGGRKDTLGLGASNDTAVAVIGAELNLIGQRIDEALDESDRFLDRALLEGKQAVRIIHGFGTGALRKAVREYLRKHPGVKSWRPGEDNEGGDGATVAVLDT